MKGKQYDNDLKAPKAFRSLFVDGLSIDQLWEELQLQNKPALGYLQSSISYLLSEGEDIELPRPAKKQKVSHQPASPESESGEDWDSESGEGSLDSLEGSDEEVDLAPRKKGQGGK